MIRSAPLLVSASVDGVSSSRAVGVTRPASPATRKVRFSGPPASNSMVNGPAPVTLAPVSDTGASSSVMSRTTGSVTPANPDTW